MTGITVSDCGGCMGIGAHARWCPERVGLTAWRLGLASEAVESMADQIGSLADPIPLLMRPLSEKGENPHDLPGANKFRSDNNNCC